MLIIIDNVLKKEVKTHDMNRVSNTNYPDGNIPGVLLTENEQVIYIMDGSELAQKIADAYEFEFIFDSNGNAVDITVTKTIEQYRAEQQPEVITEPVDEEKVMLAEAIIAQETEIEELKARLTAAGL